MRTLVFLMFVFTLVNVQGQKLVRKAFVDPRTETIQIDAQYCYRIDLKTEPINEIHVSATMEGEYAKDLLVSITESGATAMISSEFHPNFINPNDKLSAHKVVSIALEIRVPEYKNVEVFGTGTNVFATGTYEHLTVALSNGRCSLQNISQSVKVTTQTGDIVLSVPRGEVSAESVYGTVRREHIPFGNDQFVLKSVEGDILLMKTK